MKYIPSPYNTDDIELPSEILGLCEIISQNTHEVWAKKRIEQGWVYGKTRNDEKKETPCLVPYNQLDESEKEFDRSTSLESIKLIIKLGYRIVKDE